MQNLDKSITQQNIYEKFSTFGKILSAKLETFSNSKESKGKAYVQFENEAEANAAI